MTAAQRKVLALLALSLARANRVSDDLSGSSAEEAAATDGKSIKVYTCCVHDMAADDQHVPLSVTSLRSSDKEGVDKCKLTAFPYDCQKTGKCEEECRNVVGKSVLFQVKRAAEMDRGLVAMRKTHDDERTKADKALKKAKSKAKGAQEQAAVRAKTVFAETVDRPRARLTEALSFRKAALEHLEQRRRRLAEAQKAFDDASQEYARAEWIKSSAESKANSALLNAQRLADDNWVSAKDSARRTHDSVVQAHAEAEETERVALESLTRHVASLESDSHAMASLDEGRRCSKGGVDCCCSAHRPGHGEGVAIRVPGARFLNWEACHAGRPYPGTLFGGCEAFQECSKCDKLLCVNEHGTRGPCP